MRYRKPEPGRRMLPGQRGQHRDRAHDVAAARLALQPLAHPEQRRPAAVGARDVLDQARRHARVLLAPRRACSARAAARARRSRARARARRPRRRGRRGGSRARARTRAPRRCRGAAGGTCRPAPAGRRADRVDHDHLAARLAQPVVVGVRRARRGIRAPHDDAGRVGRGLGVEALLARRRRRSVSATWPALLQTVSGSTSVAPRRLKKRCGKTPSISAQVPV